MSRVKGSVKKVPGTAQGAPDRCASRRRRYTQAERSSGTREKAIQAVIRCIAEEGLSNASAARIAERAGMTWGAIVHQFGNKESLLLAVVGRNIEAIERDLAGALAARNLSLRERISLLIDRSWRHINQPSSVAFTELVLYGRSRPQGNIRRRQAEMTIAATRKIWQELFGDLPLDARRLATARRFASAAMLGMSIHGLLEPVRPGSGKEIEALKRAIADILDPPVS